MATVALRRRVARLAAAVCVVAAGCGVTHVDAPVITVVTSLYPLAQAVSAIGAHQVRVVDLAGPDVDPRTMRLTAAQRQEVRDATLMVDIGGGFQPAVEAAARGAVRVLSLLPAVGGTNPYLWLDPHLMRRISTLIETALTTAEPAGRPVFADGHAVLDSELQSLDIDFQSSLSDCPHHTFVTADHAFARMADRYHVIDLAVGTGTDPDRATVTAAARVITAAGSNAVFVEPHVVPTTVTAAAGLAAVKVRPLSTIESPPAGGTPAARTYTNLMEEDLTAISGALSCAAVGTN